MIKFLLASQTVLVDPVVMVNVGLTSILSSMVEESVLLGLGAVPGVLTVMIGDSVSTTISSLYPNDHAAHGEKSVRFAVLPIESMIVAPSNASPVVVE